MEGYQDRGIPVGAIIIDSPWETAYNTFQWDTATYPEPQMMIDDFHADNVRVLVWITSFVNTDSPDYSYVIDQGYTVDDGQDFNWWRGTGVHIDHTNPDAQTWLHGRMDGVLDMGVDGWKVDMGADLLDATVQTFLGTITRDEFKRHYYADYFDYTRSRNPEGITVARAFSHQGGIGASVSKSPMSWQGDFDGDFTGLLNQLEYVYESAILGYGAPGVEIGGYWGTPPSKRSLIRYAQLASLTPLMENGGRDGDNAVHLPWYWDGQTVDIYRYFATLHSELAPYMFSYGVEAHLTGTSILRGTDITRRQHKLGEVVFVSVLAEDVETKVVDFPYGADWIDYWNEDVTYVGGTQGAYDAPLDRYPIFLRTGAIIPMNVQGDITGHGDASSSGEVTVNIYPGGTSEFTFHRPTGDGIEYSDVVIRAEEQSGTVEVSGNDELDYILRVKSFEAPSNVSGAADWNYDDTRKWITIKRTGSSFTVEIEGLQGYGEPTVVPPISGFSGSPRNGTAPLTVGFSDESAGQIDSWLWDFGNGGGSATRNPVVTYTTAGTYTVSLTVTGPGGSDTLTQTGYVAVTDVAQPLIHDLTVYDVANATDWSLEIDLNTGLSQYGDRSYTITSVPSVLLGAEWIRSANDSKLSNDNPVVTFRAGADVDVYVAIDDRLPQLSWLGSWNDTGLDLLNSEPRTFSLYRKLFADGEIVALGPTEVDESSMYTIIAVQAECTDMDLDGHCSTTDCDDTNAYCTTDCSDGDSDSYCVTTDCDEGDGHTHPGALEVNDGLDNQCPGDAGYGLVDEISGDSGFHNLANKDEYSWPGQPGATSYEVARSSYPYFSANCTTITRSETYWVDSAQPGTLVCFHYLVRALAPFSGSWGQDSAGMERTNVCP